MPRRHLVLSAVAALCLTAGPAYAGHKVPPPPSAPATYDVSYPQCGHALPSNITGGIVGVNNGIVLSGNPCLASEYSWAASATTYAAAFYSSTGNPGPAYSSHWPSGQLQPQACDGTNSSACAYDYGWNYGQDSFARAAAVTANAASAMWWLDVETGNSWETLESAYGQTATAQANDRDSVAGAIAALQGNGVHTIGVYSTSYQWSQIMGSSGVQFQAQPAWIAGTGSQSTAQANCTSASFTGGHVTLTQFASNGYDADYHCS
jgi:hypothetical protein